MVPLGTLAATASAIVGQNKLIGFDTGSILLGGTMRTILAKLIQQAHAEASRALKQNGVIQTRVEKEYPHDWDNAAAVAKTHPIFSVQRNGDIIFRKVTEKELKLLRWQEKWVGKAGLNIWRWRGTLRKPEALEIEKTHCRKYLEKLFSSLASRRALTTVPARPRARPLCRIRR